MDPLMVSVPAGGRHRDPMVPRERPQWTAALRASRGSATEGYYVIHEGYYVFSDGCG